MKLSFKFWLWRINLKTSRLDKDEKIGYLANELAKEIMASGRKIPYSADDDSYGGFDVDIFNLGCENAKLKVGSILNGWEVTTKPTFKKF